MRKRVAIVGVAQTKYQENRPDCREAELVYEVVSKVLENMGLPHTWEGMGIDAAVTCSSDLWDGRTISSATVQDVVGAHGRTENKVADDAINAVYYAMAAILSGKHETVLVAAHTKESNATYKSVVENSFFDPILMRPLGLDFLSAAALQAKRYMDRYGITKEQCAKVAVRSLKNAGNNPFAQRAMDITVDDVLHSRTLVSPIRLLDAKPVSDGAVAMILTTEEKAGTLTDKPVWISGAENCYNSHYLGERELSDCEALRSAAQRAYRMAGITNPLKEIDVAEISAEYSYQELLWTEGLGFCAGGEGGRLIDSGSTDMDGELPVNPSGGTLAGNPSMIAGMARAAEAVLQLRGEANGRQIPEAKTALAHGFTGACGQHQCVLILEK